MRFKPVTGRQFALCPLRDSDLTKLPDPLCRRTAAAPGKF
jgi:hypothetical protein